MVAALRLILADQLSESLASLRDADAKNDVILLCEVAEETTYVKHHKKKIAFLFAAMRHFAQTLREKGFTVDYITLDDSDNSGSFTGEVQRAIARHKPEKLVLTECGEWRVSEMFRNWQEQLDTAVEIREDDRFLCSIEEFRSWAKDRKQLRMEFFYREMRKKHRVLLEGDDHPVGGKWNYDAENRKPPEAGMEFPKRMQHAPDEVTQEVITLVEERFADHFGTTEDFQFAVTRRSALLELNRFIEEFLPSFGDYQDAMVKGEAFLYHSLLSAYINCGLLLPKEVIELAETAYHEGHVPLNAAEGFIRQILGWREYVRGIYWLHMPEYQSRNFLDANRPLPDFYWTGETDMHCIREAVSHTQRYAYSHHIQRLMVTGNFALLAGIQPEQVCEWYLAVYADAYEWVELPNTAGMALFADGGLLGSKPYAASGKYIDRMSDYCKDCRYNPKENTGEDACPFNGLYWHFMHRNREALQDNHRLRNPYATMKRMDQEKLQTMLDEADAFLKRLQSSY
jgi:deoxyribodipyrimidine photolyase-related protein